MKVKQYDYLIVGSGLFGAVFAYEAFKRGLKCLVLEKRNHIGGNVYTQEIAGINVHKYGAHIFHTNDKGIWNYINQFAEFNRYTNSPIANYKGRLYNLPFNMNTFYTLWGVKTPQEAREKIDAQIKHLNIGSPKNLEEQALKLVGPDIYEILIKHYTEKQWGREAKDLPAFIIKRLPVRFTYDNNYFSDNYQGIPIGGYTQIFEKLLAGTEVKLNTDYLQDKEHWNSLARKIVYCGPIDAFYDYKFGKLEYRSLKFETQVLDIDNYQGNAVMNFTDAETPYTRIYEHKHFEFGKQDSTVVTKEYPNNDPNGEPYYPVNDVLNSEILKKYQVLSADEKSIIFGGRLAEYKYYDMHQIIASALTKVKQEFS